jgi:hypothetical protein
MPALLEDYSTIEDLAAEVDVSVRTIRRWTRSTSPALAVTYVGRRPLVARRDFEAWLAAHRVQRNTRRGR